MAAELLKDLPGDLPNFLKRFGTDAKCRAYLVRARWPVGFRCTGCGHDLAYSHKKRLIEECTACGKQHSNLSPAPSSSRHKTGLRDVVPGDLPGDLEQGRHLGDGAQASDGLRQLPDRLELAAQDPQGHGAAGAAAAEPAGRGRRDLCRRPATGTPGRGAAGKTRVAGAVETGRGQARGRRLGRLRLAVVPDVSAKSLEGFLAGAVARPASVATDGWSGYAGLAPAGWRHEPLNLNASWGDAALRLPGDPPGVRPGQALAARHPSRRGLQQAPAGLPRRVHLPLQPPHRQKHQPSLRPPDRARRADPAHPLPRPHRHGCNLMVMES